MSRRKKLLAGERCRGGKTGNRLISQDHRSPIYLPVASGLGTALLRHRTTGYSVPQTGNTPNRPLWITDRQHTLVFTTCVPRNILRATDRQHTPVFTKCLCQGTTDYSGPQVGNTPVFTKCPCHGTTDYSGPQVGNTPLCSQNICAKEQQITLVHKSATPLCSQNVCAMEQQITLGHRPATPLCPHSRPQKQVSSCSSTFRRPHRLTSGRITHTQNSSSSVQNTSHYYTSLSNSLLHKSHPSIYQLHKFV